MMINQRRHVVFYFLLCQFEIHAFSLSLSLNLKQIGSSVHLETLAYKPANLQRRLRLNHIRQLARSLIHPIGDDTGTGIHQVAAELIAKGHLSFNGKLDQQLCLNGPHSHLTILLYNLIIILVFKLTFYF